MVFDGELIMPRNVMEVNPLRIAWEKVGKKFDWLILEQFFVNQKKRRFNEILNHVTGLTPSILSNRLKSFEKHGILSKNLVMGLPVKTEYHLTEKGEKMALVLDLLKGFGK